MRQLRMFNVEMEVTVSSWFKLAGKQVRRNGKEFVMVNIMARSVPLAESLAMDAVWASDADDVHVEDITILSVELDLFGMEG